MLEDSVNGDKIVKKELDIHVKEMDENKDSIKYALKVDFTGILNGSTTKQTMAVFDLLDLRIARGTDNMEPYTRLIRPKDTFIPNLLFSYLSFSPIHLSSSIFSPGQKSIARN